MEFYLRKTGGGSFSRVLDSALTQPPPAPESTGPALESPCYRVAALVVGFLDEDVHWNHWEWRARIVLHDDFDAFRFQRKTNALNER